MAQTFKPVTLVHKDGRERVANTQAQLVDAEWNGFRPKAKADAAAAQTLEQATTAAVTSGEPTPSAIDSPAKPGGKRS